MNSSYKQKIYNKKKYPFFNLTTLGYIGFGKTVLDVGCWDGRLGEALKKKANVVWGIDISTNAVRQAKRKLDKVFCLDVETDQPPLPLNYFDVIIFSDILEHLFDPLSILTKYKRFLKKKGVIIISMPNVAYWQVRLDLLLGKFDYRDLTILEPTHIRFFTLKSAKQLFKKAGLSVQKINYSRIGWRGVITNLWPTLLCSQFVFVLKK